MITINKERRARPMDAAPPPRRLPVWRFLIPLLGALLLFAGQAPAQAAPKPVQDLFSGPCPYSTKAQERDGCVTHTQQLLNKHGAKIEVDGSFGTKTLAAVKQYQGAHHLTKDGKVGPNTKASLEGHKAPQRQAQAVAYAKKIAAVGSWHGGKPVYAFDGGHGATPGPDVGNLSASGSKRGIGLDCSGFVRFAYSEAEGTMCWKPVPLAIGLRACTRPAIRFLVIWCTTPAAMSDAPRGDVSRWRQGHHCSPLWTHARRERDADRWPELLWLLPLDLISAT